jgi:DNA-binding beta-propeller fold protein YncE
MTALKNILVLLLIILAFVSGRSTFREMTVGAGPRVSSGPLQGDTRELAFVANAVAGTVSLLDLESLAVIKTLDITPDGKQVGPARNFSQWLAQGFIEARGGLNFAQDTDLSRDGTVLFVSRGFLGDVAAFDVASGELLWRAPVAGFRADHMTISADGERLFVSTLIRSGNKVQVFATDTGLELGDFRAGQWPHDLHTDGTQIYVASLGDMLAEPAARDADADAYRITLADADSLTVTRHWNFDTGIRPFAVTRDHKRAYLQLSNSHALITHDLENDAPLTRLELPIDEGVSEADWDFEAPHHGLALTADESALCLAGRASDYAAIVTTEPLALRHLVDTGDAPSWAAIDADGTRCILPNSRSDDVSIVSMAQGRELARVAVDRGPRHVTVGRVPLRLLQGLN